MLLHHKDDFVTQTLDGPTRTRSRATAPAIEWVRYVLSCRPEALVTDFANAAGVSRNTIANLIGGKPRPSLNSATYERIMSTNPEDIRLTRRRVIPGDTAREVVESLVAKGWNLQEIADAGGLKRSTLTPANLDRVYAETVARLLYARLILNQRAPHGENESRSLVPSYKVLRRAEALMVMGWRREDIAQRGQVSLHAIRTPKKFVLRPTAERVFEAFDSMRLTPGGSDITRRQARRLGYAPWVAWPGQSIDKEDAVPDWKFLDDTDWREAIRKRYEIQ